MTGKPARSKLGNIAIFFFRLAISLVTISIVLHFAVAESVWNSIRIASVPFLIVTATLLSLHLMLCVWRWRQILLHLYHCAVDFWKLSFLFGLSEVVGQVLPSFVGMDVFRAGALARSIPLDVAVRSVFCDRVLGLLTLLILITLTLPGFALLVDQGVALYGLVALCAIGLLGFAILLKSGQFLGRFSFTEEMIVPTITDLRQGLIQRRLIGPVVGVGLVIHVLSAILLWACGMTIGIDLGFWACVSIAPAAFLVSSLPISLGGWGLREGALAAGFSLLGTSPSQVVATSLLYGLTSFFSGGLGMMIGSHTMHRNSRTVPEKRET